MVVGRLGALDEDDLAIVALKNFRRIKNSVALNGLNHSSVNYSTAVVLEDRRQSKIVA